MMASSPTTASHAAGSTSLMDRTILMSISTHLTNWSRGGFTAGLGRTLGPQRRIESPEIRLARPAELHGGDHEKASSAGGVPCDDRGRTRFHLVVRQEARRRWRWSGSVRMRPP